MKNNPFADLTSGDMSKYKERNDAAIRLERAEGLDARITDMNSKKKDLAWADLVFAFYDEEKRLNSDIFDIATKVPVLEQMKKEAKFIKEKDAEENAQRKKDAEKKIAEEALAIDEYIIELSGASRSIYWCNDVEKTDERVKNLPSDTRSKCKKLSLLDSLKVEVGYVNEAAELDKKIKAFKSNKTHGETWSKNVISFAASIDKNVLPYMNEKSTCDELVKVANEALGAINAERARLAREEAERKAKERAEKEAEKARQRAAEEAREKAEREEKERIEREKAEREHQKYLEKVRAEEARRKAGIRRRNLICVLVIAADLALIATAIFSQGARPYAIGTLAASAYVIMWNLIKFTDIENRKLCSGFFLVDSIHYSDIKVPFSIVNGIAMAATVPLICISDATRKFAFVFAIGLVAQSILHLVTAKITNEYFDDEYDAYYGLNIEISGYLLIISFSLCFLSGWARYLTIGIGLMLVSLIYYILSKTIGSNDMCDDQYLTYGIVKIILLTLTGIAFLFVSREFTVLAIFAFVTAAMTVAVTFFDDCDYYHLHALWYLIPLAVSFLVLFLFHGYTDYVVRDNALVAYYGPGDVLTVPDGTEIICTKAVKGRGKKITKVIIPDDVKIIGEDAFSGCSSLIEVEIEDGSKLETIESGAFMGCHSLERFVFPEGLKTIETSAFLYCYKLENICLPDSLKSIGDSAFEQCYKLGNVYIGTGLTYIAAEGFRDCGVTAFYYGGTEEQWNRIEKVMENLWYSKQWDWGIGEYSMFYNVSRDAFLAENVNK